MINANIQLISSTSFLVKSKNKEIAMLKGIIPVSVSARLTRNCKKSTPVFVSGRLLSLMTLGRDNEGLITRREYLQYFTTLSIETDAVLIADGQTGFGNELSARMTVEELGNAGAKYLVINDQIWPSTSVKISGSIAKKIFINTVKAAIYGAEDYNLQVVPKLEGINEYVYSELLNRIQALLQLGITQIIVSRSNKSDLLKLKQTAFFNHLGIALDDRAISFTEARELKPSFILPVRQTIDQIEKADNEILSF